MSLDEAGLLDEDEEQGEAEADDKGRVYPLPIPRKVNLTEVIPSLKGAPKVREFGVVDLECSDWVDAYAVGFYAAGKFRAFEGPIVNGKRVLDEASRVAVVEDFLDFYLQKQFAGLWIYAHNGGNYDFLFFMEPLMCGRFSKLGYKVEITPIQSCMFRWTITHPEREGKWILIDSLRLLPMALEQVGVRLGVGRKVDLGKILRCKKEDIYAKLALPENRNVMLNYLEQDCVVLHKGISKYQEIINALGGELKATTPSTSMDLFRRNFLDRDIYRNRHFHTCPDLNKPAAEVTCLGCGHEFIRRGLAGGRTEIFTMSSIDGEELIYKDVCSMYPAAMLERMPVGQATVIEVGGTHEQVLKTARTSIGMIDCDVFIPHDCYLPPLPVKWDGKTTSPKKGGKLVFPVGRFRGVWDTAELELLPEVGGRIERVYRQVWFEAAPVFNRFVETLYEFRNKKSTSYSEAWAELAKLLMNSNFGKWSQREEREEIVIHPPEEDLNQFTAINFQADVWSRPLYVQADHIAPQLSAHITALARSRLWRLMRELLSEGAELYYCDTDSIIYVPADPTAPVTSSSKLGELKLEHRLCKAEFVLPKLYHVRCAPHCPCQAEAKGKNEPWKRDKVKMKGFGPGLGEPPSVEEFAILTMRTDMVMGIKRAPGELRQIIRRRITKFRECMVDMGKKLRFPRVKSSPKAIKSAYDKRTVLSDGRKTMPLILGAAASMLVAETIGKTQAEPRVKRGARSPQGSAL